MVSEDRYCNRVLFMRWSNERRPFRRAVIPALHRKLTNYFFLSSSSTTRLLVTENTPGMLLTFERDVPVFDDDVNGGNSTQLVLA